MATQSGPTGIDSVVEQIKRAATSERLKWVPGFRSGVWWKRIVASIFYLFIVWAILDALAAGQPGTAFSWAVLGVGAVVVVVVRPRWNIGGGGKSREELANGGYFNPRTSRVLVEWMPYIDPGQKTVVDQFGPGALIPLPHGVFADNAMAKLYQTQNGSFIRRLPQTYTIPVPNPNRAVFIDKWKYEEVGPDVACELLTKRLRWQDAKTLFPTQFSADFACECLIRSGKQKEAQQNFPDRFPWVMNRVQGVER